MSQDVWDQQSGALADAFKRLADLRDHIKEMVSLEMPDASRFNEILDHYVGQLDHIVQHKREMPMDLLSEIGTLEEVIERMLFKANTLKPEEKELPADDRPKSSTVSFQVIVHVPIAMNVQEVTFDPVPASMDIGYFREQIADLIGLDPFSLVVRYRGNFCFPSEDSITLGMLIGDAKMRTVQLTILTESEAEKIGVIQDYKQEKKKHEMQTPSTPPMMDSFRMTSGKKRSSIPEYMVNKDQIHEYVLRLEQEQREQQQVKDEASDSDDGIKTPPPENQILSELPAKALPDQAEQASDSAVSAPPLPPPAPPPAPPPFGVPPPPPPPAPPAPGLLAGKRLPPGGIECRKLHWKTHSLSYSASIFATLPKISFVPRSLVEECWANSVNRSILVRKESRLSTDTEKKPKGKYDLPDMKQSENIGIVLKNSPPIDQLVSALQSFDESVITAEILTRLFQALPRKDDMEFVSGISEELTPENATTPVLYVKALLSVSFWDLRLRAWKTLREFDDRAAMLQQSIIVLSDAISFLLTNDSLKWMIAVILQVGNEMNLSSAQVFRIDFLSKLSSYKSIGRNSSMLDFVVRILSKHVPHALEFPQQLGEHYLKVSRRTLQAAYNDVTELHSIVEQQFKAVSRVSDQLSQNDPFLILYKKYEYASTQCDELLQLYQSLENAALKLLNHFELNVDSATAMFNEMNPVSEAQRRRQQQLDRDASRPWDVSKAEEAASSFLKAVNARSAFQSGQISDDDRRAAMNDARKHLTEWLPLVEGDCEMSKSKICVKVTDTSRLSEAIRNLFLFLWEFSEKFAKSVKALIEESSANKQSPVHRSKERRKRTNSHLSSNGISDTMLLEKRIDEALAKRRQPSPARSDDSTSSFV